MRIEKTYFLVNPGLLSYRVSLPVPGFQAQKMTKGYSFRSQYFSACKFDLHLKQVGNYRGSDNLFLVERLARLTYEKG